MPLPLLKVCIIHNTDNVALTSITHEIKNRLRRADWNLEFHQYHVNSGKPFPEVDVTYAVMTGIDDLTDDFKKRFNISTFWGLSVSGEKCAKKAIADFKVERVESSLKLKLSAEKTKTAVSEMIKAIKMVIKTKTKTAESTVPAQSEVAVRQQATPVAAPASVSAPVPVPAPKADATNSAEASLKKKIESALKAYSERPITEFTIATKSRQLNSYINRFIASDLLGEIATCPKNIGKILSKENVTALHEKYAVRYSTDSNSNFVNRGINSKELNAILNEGRKHFPAPLPTFEERKIQVEAVFQTYLDRVKDDPSNGFSFFKKSRTESRQATIQLVNVILKNMKLTSEDDFATLFTKESVEQTRPTTINGRGINSGEVNAALALARKLFPAPAEAPKAMKAC